jgi:hypothetical protein
MTTRTQRRQAQQNAVAKILLGDPSATWSNLSTFIVSPLFPEPYVFANASNVVIKRALTVRLATLLRRAHALPENGTCYEISAVFYQHPRQSTSPKNRKTTG